MLQVIQYQKNGAMSIEDVPVPALRRGSILVRNRASLISAGTERTSVVTAQASLLGKARSRPDLVKQVLENMKREGIPATVKKVRTRLDNYKELGYSCAGEVVESSVDEFSAGDRVACGGAGYASHAEFVVVPQNLAVRIPDEVTDEQAAFTTVGAIAMQGVRQAEVHLGENVVVIGLGLVGLLTVQLLKAAGCRVTGLDLVPTNFALARKLGCDVCMQSVPSSLPKIESITGGHGADAVIITAATLSNEPIELALQCVRKKGRVVLVGRVGMNIPYLPFYEKEVDIRQSCSYGPGRYDIAYEEKGIDYPFGYVRWTERRNMEGVLDLLAQGKLDVLSLVTHRFGIQDALRAYDIITGKTKARYMGILIGYPGTEAPRRPRARHTGHPVEPVPVKDGRVAIGFIGAGNFAQSYLLPALVSQKADLRGVATSRSINAKSVQEKFHFKFSATDPGEILDDKASHAVFIATRHDSHARYVIQALNKGKHVFVEKPLAVNEQQVEEIRQAYAALGPAPQQQLFVGYNRRFSAPFVDIKSFFHERREPLIMTYRVNAGTLPQTSWYLDPDQGGRIIGEGCHFIDCMSFLAGAHPVRVYAESIRTENTLVHNSDNVSIVVRFADGSVGTLLYLEGGDGSVPKEYCEVHGGGQSAIMDNFREVRLHWRGKVERKKYNGRKGHQEEVDHFLQAIQGKEPGSIGADSLFVTTLTTIKAMESLKRGAAVSL